MLTVLLRLVLRYRAIFLVLLTLLLLDIAVHNYAFHVSRPGALLDLPFSIGCNEPPLQVLAEDRENAVIVMLARNSERDAAIFSITSLEQRFNRWWHYPIVFLTEDTEPWDPEFVSALQSVASGQTSFETISQDDWSYPPWIDQARAKQAAAEQEASGVIHAGREGYHHMCRFYSGKFYDHSALQRYKWFWRVEPGVEFTCTITYDPFAAMSRNNKTYGYTIALWEVPNTIPSLFQQTSAHKDEHELSTTDLWRGMVDPSMAPYGLRNLIPAQTLRDAHGDQWNLCHYWSNFEIADMDFFRGDLYRAYFERLDRAGGFYYERWGDAAVHSLAAALFLQPEQLHYFADFGYSHAPYRACPKNAAGKQLPGSEALAAAARLDAGSPEFDDGTGCRCTCDPFGETNRPICRNRLRKGVE